MSTTGPSCLSMGCRPEDAHEGGKPCLICQDTIFSRHDLSRHIPRCLFSVSHSMSISLVIEYVVPASAVTYTAPSSVIEYVASTPDVFHAAPVTVIEHSALQRIGHEHEHTWKRRRRKNRSDDAMHFFFLFDFPC